jgi:hypothetical protein
MEYKIMPFFETKKILKCLKKFTKTFLVWKIERNFY